jgi:hypothetical protein
MTTNIMPFYMPSLGSLTMTKGNRNMLRPFVILLSANAAQSYFFFSIISPASLIVSLAGNLKIPDILTGRFRPRTNNLRASAILCLIEPYAFTLCQAKQPLDVDFSRFTLVFFRFDQNNPL